MHDDTPVRGASTEAVLNIRTNVVRPRTEVCTAV